MIFRLGRLLPAAKGPGVILVFSPIDRMVRVSLRQEALEVPPQDIITRDNVTLKVNAVIFLRVIEPRKAVVEVSNYVYQTSQFAQTTLRSVLGEQELDELLAHRDKINLRLQSILDTHTSPWGVKVTNVEVKQVDMPESMLRAMAKQAEAEREKRSKIIHAEGEFSAAQRLVDAAHLLSSEPVSVQLRYLQTLDRNRRREEYDSRVPGAGGLLLRNSEVAGEVRGRYEAVRQRRRNWARDGAWNPWILRSAKPRSPMLGGSIQSTCAHLGSGTMASSEDTEITLGTGKLLVLFFGLVGVCALFFALGYSLGRKSEPAVTTASAALTPQTSPNTTKANGGSAVRAPPMTFYKAVEQKDANPRTHRAR